MPSVPSKAPSLVVGPSGHPKPWGGAGVAVGPHAGRPWGGGKPPGTAGGQGAVDGAGGEGADDGVGGGADDVTVAHTPAGTRR